MCCVRVIYLDVVAGVFNRLVSGRIYWWWLLRASSASRVHYSRSRVLHWILHYYYHLCTCLLWVRFDYFSLINWFYFVKLICKLFFIAGLQQRWPIIHNLLPIIRPKLTPLQQHMHQCKNFCSFWFANYF